jgi:hypothetical protein
MRFTIRDLLWAMVVVGLVLAWCSKQFELNFTLATRQQLQAENERLRSAFRITGYDLKETNHGAFVVSRKPDGGPDEN